MSGPCSRTRPSEIARAPREGARTGYLAQRKPMAHGDPIDSRSTEKTSPASDAARAPSTPAGQSRGNLGAIDAVEAALAEAIAKATEAGRFDVVAQLARELEARRLARSANVVVLRPAKARRGAPD